MDRMLTAIRILTVFALASAAAQAQTVKNTPVGSHPGELCANDRATIFEDPTGVRILYDVGHTISGADDEKASAHAMNVLVRPASVILSHANEAVTEGGKLRPGSRTARILKMLNGPTPHLAISGRTMEFDGSGRCVAGC